MTKKSLVKKLLCLMLFSGMALSVLCSCAKQPGGTKKPNPTTGGNGTESGSGAESDGVSEVVFLKDWWYIHESGAAVTNFPKRPEDDADHGVYLAFGYRGRMPDIRFVGFDNPRAEEVFTELVIPEREEDEPDYYPEYRGYKNWGLCLNFDFSRMQYGEKIAIHSVTLSVNGKEQTIDTAGQLLLSRYTEAEEKVAKAEAEGEYGSIFSYSSQALSTDLQMAMEGTVRLELQNDVTIERMEIDDWVEITGVFTGYRPELKKVEFPFEAKTGSVEGTLELLVQAAPKKQEAWDPYRQYQTNLRLYYRTADGQERVYLTKLTGSPACLPSDVTDAYKDTWKAELDRVIGPPEDDGERVIFLDDYMRWEGVGVPGDFSYTLYFLYRDYMPYLLPGKAEDGAVKITRFPEQRRIGSFEHRGYRLGSVTVLLDFSDAVPGTEVHADKLRLSVGGTERTLDTSGSYSYRVMADDQVEFLESGLPGNWKELEGKDMWLASLDVTEKTVIGSMETIGALDIQEKDILVSVDRKEIGKAKDVLPLTLEPGQSLELWARVSPGNMDPYTDISFQTLLHATDPAGKEKVFVSTRRVSGKGFYSDPADAQTTEEYKTLVDRVCKKK